MRGAVGLLVALIGLAATVPVAAAAPPPIQATTRAPRVDTRGGSPLRVMTRAEYDVDRTEDPAAVPVEHDPWSERPSAYYATLGPHEARISLAVMPAPDGAARFIVDTDRDGDLRDERVLKTKPAEFGQQVRLRLSSPDVPIGLAYEPRDDKPPHVFLLSSTFRDGTIRVGRTKVRFAVEGDLGHYGDEYQGVFFDTDGDRQVDDDYNSDERFTAADEYVNLGGVSYAFEVSTDGDRLTLEPLDEPRPDRVRLAAGNPAPDFEFVDTDGEAGRLSAYRGKVLLLYVWATWCGPCRWETPKLVEAYRQFNAGGFEILGVAKQDQITDVRGYIAENGIEWRQVVDSGDAPIVTLYRADGVPSLVLIDRDGTILEREIRGDQLAERLSGLIELQSEP